MAMPIIQLTSDDVTHLAKPHIDASVKPRIIIERAIVRRTAQALLDAGYRVSVNNGEEQTAPLDNIDAIMGEVMATDEEHIEAWRKEDRARHGAVYFVYGNDGWDVIADYSTKLEEVLKPVNDWAETLDNGYFCESPDAAVCRKLLADLIAWVDNTSMATNQNLAGINTKPLNDARKFVGMAPRGWNSVEGGGA